MRESKERLPYLNTAFIIAEFLAMQNFSYSEGFSGDPDLLQATARFLNRHFNPRMPVEPSQFSTAPGASSSIDALLYNICDPGDIVLIPAPYWGMILMKDILKASANLTT